MRTVDSRHWALLGGCVLAVAITLANTYDPKYSGYPEVETQHVVFYPEESTEPEKAVFEAQEAIVEVDVTEPETVEEFATVQELVVRAKASEVEPETEPEPETEYFPIYEVDGERMDLDLQRFLYEELKSQGIEWWMPYAILTCYQESGFDIYDITNGVDMGLLQYRVTYWDERAARYGYPGADIFNPYVQIYIYVRQTAERLNSGCSIESAISRHKTSDHVTALDYTYISQVMGHYITQIR